MNDQEKMSQENWPEQAPEVIACLIKCKKQREDLCGLKVVHKGKRVHKVVSHGDRSQQGKERPDHALLKI